MPGSSHGRRNNFGLRRAPWLGQQRHLVGLAETPPSHGPRGPRFRGRRPLLCWSSRPQTSETVSPRSKLDCYKSSLIVSCQTSNMFYRATHRASPHPLTRHSLTHPFPRGQTTGQPSFSRGKASFPPSLDSAGSWRMQGQLCVMPQGFALRIP